jgi:hypothetical protein
MLEFENLDYRDFESLVGALLKREGFQIIRGPGPTVSRGPDYEVISPENDHTLVEVKHFRRPISTSQVLQFAGDLDRYRQQAPHAMGLLVTSAQLTPLAKERISKIQNLKVWDKEAVQERAAKHPDLEDLFQVHINDRKEFDKWLTKLVSVTFKPIRSHELAASLRAVPYGLDGWKDYERVCTEILTYVFMPELAAPDIQVRSDDGLDIIDAIFPIRSHQPPWALVRSEYRTRFVVAEFKNYREPIGQTQVESIAQYLWRPAQRFFGVLVSRHAPSASAITQRRRKWLEEEKCIVFLKDEDLLEMLELREAGGQPFDVIDAQLEDFLRTLTP